MSSEREIALVAPRSDLNIKTMTLEQLEAKSAFLNQWGAYNADDQGWEAVMEDKAEIDEEIRRRKAQDAKKS